MFLESCWTPTWAEPLPDHLQDEIKGRLSLCKFGATLCPPILVHHPSALFPTTDLDLAQGFLVAHDKGLFCVSYVGIQAGWVSQKLLIYNPTATRQKFQVLPPDPYNVHPVVIHAP
jgi:hypothetical protein